MHEKAEGRSKRAQGAKQECLDTTLLNFGRISI